MKEFFKSMFSAIKCFFDWPMLHSRIMSYTAIWFFIGQLDKLRDKDSTTLLANSLAQGYQTALLIVIGLYIAPKIAEKLGDAVISWRFGAQPIDKKDPPPEQRPPSPA